jgi:hypothetical protein
VKTLLADQPGPARVAAAVSSWLWLSSNRDDNPMGEKFRNPKLEIRNKFKFSEEVE